MWVKLDDRYYEHPAIAGLSDKAFRLHTAAICRCNQQLTDGHIGELDLRVIQAVTRAKQRHVDELVDAGRWETNGSGYHISGWLDWNLPAEIVKERRRKDAERKKGNP